MRLFEIINTDMKRLRLLTEQAILDYDQNAKITVKTDSESFRGTFLIDSYGQAFYIDAWRAIKQNLVSGGAKSVSAHDLYELGHASMLLAIKNYKTDSSYQGTFTILAGQV